MSCQDNHVSWFTGKKLRGSEGHVVLQRDVIHSGGCFITYNVIWKSDCFVIFKRYHNSLKHCWYYYYAILLSVLSFPLILWEKGHHIWKEEIIQWKSPTGGNCEFEGRSEKLLTERFEWHLCCCFGSYHHQLSVLHWGCILSRFHIT